MDHKNIYSRQNELFNFNPAGLYESHSFKTLMPYIKNKL